MFCVFISGVYVLSCFNEAIYEKIIRGFTAGGVDVFLNVLLNTPHG
jgi:hypothetical protein